MDNLFKVFTLICEALWNIVFVSVTEKAYVG